MHIVEIGPAATQDAAGGAVVAFQAIEVTRVYGRGDAAVRALNGISVDIEAGKFTAIMGPSGSGKSTLMHCMAGLDSVSEGHILFGDVDLGSLKDRRLSVLRRERMGFVFQSFKL